MNSTPSPIEAYSGNDFYRRYQHMRAPRNARSVGEISFSEFGYLIDTQIDLLQAGLLAETVDKIPTTDDPTIIKPRPLPPDYVYNYFGDYRVATSFFRPDKHDADSSEPAKPSQNLHGLAKFMQAVHAESRKFPIAILKNKVTWPDAVLTVEKQIDEAIHEYRELVRTHGGNYTQIPPNTVAPINERVIALIGKLNQALEEIQPITINLPSGPIQIPNKKQIHPELPGSSTASVLYGLQNAAKGVANLRMLPPDYVKYSMNVIGAESLLTDTVQYIMDEISPDGAVFQSAMKEFRSKLETQVKSNTRELQMLGLFHRILDSAYPVAYDDVDHLLRLCGEKDYTAINQLQEPKEVAVILYAAAKRIAKEPSLDKTLSPQLLALAESVSTLRSPNTLRQALTGADATLTAFQSLADQSGIEPLQRAADLVRSATLVQDMDEPPARAAGIGR